MTDPQLRQEMATADGRYLRGNPSGDSVDDVEAAFDAVIIRTTELVIQPQERRRPGQGRDGDAQTKAELQRAVRHACMYGQTYSTSMDQPG